MKSCTSWQNHQTESMGLLRQEARMTDTGCGRLFTRNWGEDNF